MLFLLASLVACVETADSGSSPVDGEESPYLDATEEYASAPEGGIEIRTPDFEIPPNTEALRCYFGTYTGPTVGVNWVQTLESEYSHHSQLKTVPEGDPAEDGDLIDCEESGLMSAYTPIFESVQTIVPEEYDGNWLNLEDGMAMKLREGQRWVLDMHFVNTTDKTLIVNGGVNLDSIPADEVERWASALQFDNGGVTTPPGVAETDSFSCAFPADMEILSLLGHMHYSGTAYAMDYDDEQGGSTRVYDIPDWQSGDYASEPLILSFQPGEFAVKAGESLTTRCSFFNETDAAFEFPDEMCTTVVVATPLEDPLSCIRGVYRNPGDGP
ncbi:MAG: hypothetical protein Q8P18_29645 [Pseudomonadota bacterium]|nr:hypothetical protein [Pseudomonadota bacterium]